MNRRACLTGAATGLGALLAGCTSMATISNGERRTESQTYEVKADTRLQVHSRNGSITVDVHDRDDIAVDAEIRGPSRDAIEDVSIADTRSGDELQIEPSYENEDSREQTSVELTIQIPSRVFIERLRTRNGSITADVPMIADDAELRTSNGSIDAALADGLDATISATTTNGSVAVNGLNLDSVEQSEAELSGRLGDGTYTLSLETTNGSVNLRTLSE
jgi:DUF4097 and DUF4098 domain-containing protein YvlB